MGHDKNKLLLLAAIIKSGCLIGSDQESDAKWCELLHRVADQIGDDAVRRTPLSIPQENYDEATKGAVQS